MYGADIATTPGGTWKKQLPQMDILFIVDEIFDVHPGFSSSAVDLLSVHTCGLDIAQKKISGII